MQGYAENIKALINKTTALPSQRLHFAFPAGNYLKKKRWQAALVLKSSQTGLVLLSLFKKWKTFTATSSSQFGHRENADHVSFSSHRWSNMHEEGSSAADASARMVTLGESGEGTICGDLTVLLHECCHCAKKRVVTWAPDLALSLPGGG